jgi:enoyl-CoA hydratase/carnithine racemase
MTELLIENIGAVRVLTMNRPDKLNALNFALTRALVEGLRAADADESVACVILTGAGRGFCAGADTSEFKDLTPENQRLVEERAQLTMSMHRLFSQMSKPVISAINGFAMGGGAGVALACDMAIAGTSAKIGYPEVKHGIVAAIVMPNLVRQLGRKAAFELLATGQTISPERALELGMINRVVPDDKLMEETLALAQTVAGFGRQAMATTKALFHEVVDLPLMDALERGRETNAKMRAFRKPQ